MTMFNWGPTQPPNPPQGPQPFNRERWDAVLNSLLRLFRVTVQTSSQHSLSAEELRTVVLEAGVMIPKRHQAMLLGILELEEITVNDIMVPRNEVEGIDLEDPWEEIVAQLTRSPYTVSYTHLPRQ